MGQTLVNFSRVVPHGLLTFFSSYQAKDECVQYWLESGIMASLRKLKEVCQGNVVKTQKKKTCISLVLSLKLLLILLLLLLKFIYLVDRLSREW